MLATWPHTRQAGRRRSRPGEAEALEEYEREQAEEDAARAIEEAGAEADFSDLSNDELIVFRL